MTGPRASRSRRPSLVCEALSAMAVLLSEGKLFVVAFSFVLSRRAPRVTHPGEACGRMLRNVDWITNYVCGDWERPCPMNMPVAGLVLLRLRSAAVLSRPGD